MRGQCGDEADGGDSGGSLSHVLSHALIHEVLLMLRISVKQTQQLQTISYIPAFRHHHRLQYLDPMRSPSWRPSPDPTKRAFVNDTRKHVIQFVVTFNARLQSEDG